MDIETALQDVTKFVEHMAHDELIPHLIVVPPDGGMVVNAMPEYGGWESTSLLHTALRGTAAGALCFLCTETWIWPDESPGARVPNTNRMTDAERRAAGVREGITIKVWTHPNHGETRRWRAYIGEGRALEPWREIASTSATSGIAPAN